MENVFKLHETIYQNLETQTGYEGLKDILSNLSYQIDLGIRQALSVAANLFNTNTINLENIAKYKTTQPSIKELNSYYKKIEKILDENEINLPKLFNTYVPTIMGLKASIPEVLNFLNKHSSDVHDLVKVLKDMDFILDGLMTAKKDDVKRILPSKSEIKEIEKRANEINKDLKALYDTSLMTDRKKIKELVKSPKQLKTSIIESLKLGDIYRLEKQDEIFKLYRKVADKLKILVEHVDESVDNKQLSEYILAVAKYITEVSFVLYTYVAITDLLVAIMKTIEARLENDKSFFEKIKNKISKLSSLLVG